MNNAALYIHIPWCIKKCPYCDFNSHEVKKDVPETQYIQALIEDFKRDITLFGRRNISSVFIGGGTPSLFSAQSYKILFNELKDLAYFDKNIEITIEANPGTIDLNYLADYRKLGINRLSLGVQSLHDNLLKKIGRIHSAQEAINAIKIAKNSGFDNINVDLMYGIPTQTLQDGINDIKKAIDLDIQHISWYQFTIEKNTYFYKHPPPNMPSEAMAAKLEQQALDLLKAAGFIRYEISAFKKHNYAAKHNLNYWNFGDYFGIGAGAHGKLTELNNKSIIRTQKPRLPQSYLAAIDAIAMDLSLRKDDINLHLKTLTINDIIFEFMLNTTRIYDKIPITLFTQQTRLPISIIEPLWKNAETNGLIILDSTHWTVSELGRRFTNDLQIEFLLPATEIK